jgi:ubiquinone/menaquinone biosynthesis C-methylase UbiE
MAAHTRWTANATVRGFAASPPNERLLRFAAVELIKCGGRGRALDIGCGAARNLAPLAAAGWQIFGVDTSRQMLSAAVDRVGQQGTTHVQLAEAAMDRLPLRSGAFDLVIEISRLRSTQSGSWPIRRCLW